MRAVAGLATVLILPVLIGACAARSMAVNPSASARGSLLPTVERTDPRLAAALLEELATADAPAQVQVAREYRRLGILDAAHRRLERALKGQPRYAPAHEEMARVWRDWQRADIALGYAYRAVFFDTHSAGAHNTLGTVLDALGRYDDARSAYEAAVRLEPHAGWALNNLCSLEYRMGRFEDARRHCEAAIKAVPALVKAHNNLALTFAATADMERARASFLAAGGSAAAHYNVGILHLANGNYEGAAAEFEEAIKERPDFTAAKTRAHEARMRLIERGPAGSKR